MGYGAWDGQVYNVTRRSRHKVWTQGRTTQLYDLFLIWYHFEHMQMKYMMNVFATYCWYYHLCDLLKWISIYTLSVPSGCIGYASSYLPSVTTISSCYSNHEHLASTNIKMRQNIDITSIFWLWKMCALSRAAQTPVEWSVWTNTKASAIIMWLAIIMTIGMAGSQNTGTVATWWQHL